jgi:hypothetical protein
MDPKELTDLQNEESWEFGEGADTQVRPRKARAVVSVAFPSDDFERVARYAAENGFKVSELIRLATLSYVSPGAVVATGQLAFISVGGPDQVTAYFENITPATVAASAAFDAVQVTP